MEALYNNVSQEVLGLDDPELQKDLGRLVWTKGLRRMCDFNLQSPCL